MYLKRGTELKLAAQEVVNLLHKRQVQRKHVRTMDGLNDTRSLARWPPWSSVPQQQLVERLMIRERTGEYRRPRDVDL